MEWEWIKNDKIIAQSYMINNTPSYWNHEAANMPFFVNQYCASLGHHMKTSIGIIYDLANFRNAELRYDATVWFYSLQFPADYVGVKSNDNLLVEMRETVQKLEKLGFKNMNHIFEYNSSIIFMKATGKEISRLTISNFLREIPKSSSKANESWYNRDILFAKDIDPILVLAINQYLDGPRIDDFKH